MKKRIVFSVTFFTALAVIAIGMASCNKTFDAPPAYIAPNITANSTIMALKSKYDSLANNTTSLISTDIIITGTIIADDKSGNFYKNIVIQDSTGGISIQLSQTNLYTTYNIGKQVWIKCNGLYMGNYNNSLTLGAGPGLSSSGNPTMEGIPAPNIGQYVIPGALVNSIKPTVVTASQLTTTLLNPLVNTLIELDNYQFLAADTLRTYADSSLVSTTAGTFYPQLQCATTNTTLELYNSNFASFANLRVPSGNGALIGVFTVYKQYPEIEIRDTSDVKFYNPRCGNSGGGGGGTGTLITIAALRAMYVGADITLAAGTQITGTIITDTTNKNFSKGNLVIEDGSGHAIKLYLGSTSAPLFNIGDSVLVNAGGDKVTSYKGGPLELDVTVSQCSKVGTGKTVTPIVTTIADLNAALATPQGSSTNIENTLVEILGATASGGSTYSGSRTLTDATGTTTLYTASGSSFASQSLPPAAMTWVGYAYFYSSTVGNEFQIRNLSDVF